MNVFEKSLASLDNLLAITSNDELMAIYNKINNNFEGPSMQDYFTHKGKCHTISVRMPDGISSLTLFSPPLGSYKIPEKNNPGLSGVVFFLCNIAI